MEKYNLPQALTLHGVQVKTFPLGIKEAFDGLMQAFGNTRAYYGVSWCGDGDSIIYYAMAPELFEGESKQYDYETLTIPKGLYHTETIHNWMTKTDCIKDVFHDLMRDRRPDENNPAIEWYLSDDEMMCMVKQNE